MRALTEKQRDQRDLTILKRLDAGLTWKEVAKSVGVAVGTIAKLLREIREDEAKQ